MPSRRILDFHGEMKLDFGLQFTLKHHTALGSMCESTNLIFRLYYKVLFSDYITDRTSDALVFNAVSKLIQCFGLTIKYCMLW